MRGKVGADDGGRLMRTTIYFNDLTCLVNASQCDLCGEWRAEEDLHRLELDEAGHWHRICLDCQATMEG